MVHADAAASIMFCANMLNSILDEAVQIHGGSGYIWESEINRLYRGNKLLEIGAGTTEVRKMIISQELISIENVVCNLFEQLTIKIRKMIGYLSELFLELKHEYRGFPRRCLPPQGSKRGG